MRLNSLMRLDVGVLWLNHRKWYVVTHHHKILCHQNDIH